MPMLQDLPPLMNMGCVPQDIDDDVFSELARIGADDCIVAAGPGHDSNFTTSSTATLPPPRPCGTQRG